MVLNYSAGTSTLKLRDPSAWYHIVVIYDSTTIGMARNMSKWYSDN